MKPTCRLLQLIQTLFWLGSVQGHGRLIEPPSRSSMWRFGYDTPVNLNDNQLFCGGFGVQYSLEVGGRCGVCGDPWNGIRENEYGGKYGTGTIVRSYIMGQVINVTVDLTSNYKGYFEFRLCQKDDQKKRATWDCMNKHVLVNEETGLTRYPVDFKFYSTKITLKLRLPMDVKCKACVLQWKYNAGNNLGTSQNGEKCVGCGNQEQYYGCADIAIGYINTELGVVNEKNKCNYVNVEKDHWLWNCSERQNPFQPIMGKGMSDRCSKASSYTRRDWRVLFDYISLLLLLTHSLPTLM